MVQFAFVDRGGRLVTVRRLVDRTSFNARCVLPLDIFEITIDLPFSRGNDVVNVVVDYRVPTTQCVNVIVIRMKIS